MKVVVCAGQLKLSCGELTTPTHVSMFTMSAPYCRVTRALKW